MIYFDHASTAGRRPACVAAAMVRALRLVSANPGRSSHPRSIEAARIILEAREQIAALINASDSSHVVFTKNATEAINVVLFGYLRPGDLVLAGRYEHNAVMRALRELETTRSIRVIDIPECDSSPVDLNELERLLGNRRESVRLVALGAASNVTGEIMPIGEVGALCRRHRGMLLVDGAQGAGLLDLDVQRDGIDALALTGHKSLMGPPGTGALYLRNPSLVGPLVFGGTGSRSEEERQPDFPPDKFEAGTLNLPGLAGLGAGVRRIRKVGVARRRAQDRDLFVDLWDHLGRIPGIRRYGRGDPNRRLALLSFNADGWEVGELARELDRAGIYCRSGLHCAPRAHRALGTLATGGTIRFSLSTYNTHEEIATASALLARIVASRG